MTGEPRLRLMTAAMTKRGYSRYITLPGLPSFVIQTHPERDRYISTKIVETGNWEPLETELIRQLLPHYDLFLDVGANIGWYSAIASLSLGTRGVVHAFEPDPDNFALLEDMLRLNGLTNVVARQVAVAERVRGGQLMRDPENMGDHRLDALRHGRDTGLPVAVVTLDQFFADPPPFLLKADTQGSEPAVLAGMTGMIDRCRSDCSLVLEFWPYGIESTGGSVKAMLQSIAALPDHVIAVIDENAGRLWPSTVAELAEAASGDLAPVTQAFRNLAVLPLGIANSGPIRRLYKGRSARGALSQAGTQYSGRSSKMPCASALKELGDILVCPECRNTIIHSADNRLACVECGWVTSFVAGVLDLFCSPSKPSDETRTPALEWPIIVSRIAAVLGLPHEHEPELLSRMIAPTRVTGDPGLDAEELLFLERFSITNEDLRLSWEAVTVPPSVRSSASFWISVRIRNGGPFPISSEGNQPILLSYHWLTHDGATIHFEGVRTALPMALSPGQAITVPMKVVAPHYEGRLILGILPIQEGRRWIEEFRTEHQIEVTEEYRALDLPQRTESDIGPFSEHLDGVLATEFMDDALRAHLPGISLRGVEIGGGIRPAFISGKEALARLSLFINLDISLKLLRIAEILSSFHSNEVSSRIIHVRTDANSLPLRPGSVDTAIFCRSLHHFTNPGHVLRHVAECVRPGGLLFLLCEPCGTAYDHHTLGLINRNVSEQVFADTIYLQLAREAGWAHLEGNVDWGFSLKACFRRT